MSAWPIWLSLAILMCSEVASQASFLESCDLVYPTMSKEEILSGRLPYLFGGKAACTSSMVRPQPGCQQESNFTRFCEAALPHEWRHTYDKRSHDWKMNIVGALENCPEHLIRSFVDELLRQEIWQTLQLTPCEFFRELKGRTLWLLGDSQMLDMMKAIECFLRPFWADADWQEARMKKTFAEGPVNPTCLDMQLDTRICFLRFNKGDVLLHEGLPFLLQEASHQDFAVLNFGLHGWWMEDIKIVAAFLDIYRNALPIVFWKDMSPHHKPHIYQSADSQEEIECKPILDADQQAKDQPFNTAIWFNNLTIPVLKQSSIRVIEDEAALRPFWKHHRQGECLHFCQPSAPQVWISSLYQSLTDAQALSTSTSNK